MFYFFNKSINTYTELNSEGTPVLRERHVVHVGGVPLFHAGRHGDVADEALEEFVHVGLLAIGEALVYLCRVGVILRGADWDRVGVLCHANPGPVVDLD